MGFEIGDFLAKNVPNLDTPKGEILKIDINNLDPDPNNFYQLSGIDELAANIEFAGLQQPLVVRKGEAEGRYTVVSGHRRLEALKLLVSEGKDFATVNCLLDEAKGSPELQELKLIMANSDTRRMSSADISRQAERVEELLYKLKEQGVEFPGRMRDHVAEACKVSKSKLARLKVIRDGLTEFHFVKEYKKGDLNESTAYELAKQPPYIQDEIYDNLILKGNEQIKWMGASSVERYLSQRKDVYSRSCKINPDHKCNHQEAFLEKFATTKYSYIPCLNGTKCCANCSELAKCKYACPHMKDKKAELKQIRKAEIADEKARQAEAKNKLLADKREIWKRWAKAAKAAGVSAKDFAEKMHIYGTPKDHQIAIDGFEVEVSEHSSLPYGYRVDLDAIRTLREAAEFMDCSIDELLGNDKPRFEAILESAGAKAPLPSKPKWRTGDPTVSGSYAAKFDAYGVTVIDVAYYDSYLKKWRYSKDSSLQHDELCVGWFKIPEEDEE